MASQSGGAPVSRNSSGSSWTCFNAEDLVSLNRYHFQEFCPRFRYSAYRVPFVTIVIRSERLKVHKAIVQKFPILNEYFAHGADTAQWAYRPQETFRSWKILLLAMYGNNELRTLRDEYKPVDFANALVVAAHWRMANDDVLNSIRFMMNQNFRVLRYWPEIPRNPLTLDLHEAIFAEVADAFWIYKFLTRPAQIFHPLSFGIFLLRHCDRQFLLEDKMPSIEEELRELVEEAIRWEESGCPFQEEYTAMFM
ncbi:hypothetical protein SLS62_006362 [Diatrype stigma]|uniref:Uncharacterized protein n=1 Tax=Diatrype stigma TaxID=117547 RepID=A0AAN9YP53_9PEZI